MKRNIIYLLPLFFLFAVSSCMEDPEVWNSKVVDMSGDWYVQYNHESYGVDPFGVGFAELLTYNTASDDGTEMWLTDVVGGSATFWDYKVKVPVSTGALTFGSNEALVNAVEGYEIGVKIMNGKIIEDAVTLPSGYVTDSIYFEVWFEDLEGATGIADDKLLVGGYRRTGFIEDEPH
ncbi:MAG: hypothetical protein JW735_01235 [Prolixibacteraceae bacterium]|nr:hypothetical protein [Prolixibacteraceae bacterium]